MATFPLAHRNYLLRVDSAKQIARIMREVDGNIVDEREGKRYAHTAADSKTLRGIPAIGRGVAGAVPGTNPESVCHR